MFRFIKIISKISYGILLAGGLATALVLRSVGDTVATGYVVIVIMFYLTGLLFTGALRTISHLGFFISLLPTAFFIYRLGFLSVENLAGAKNHQEYIMALGFVISTSIYLCFFLFFGLYAIKASGLFRA